jgi:hypothetical protein
MQLQREKLKMLEQAKVHLKFICALSVAAFIASLNCQHDVALLL